MITLNSEGAPVTPEFAEAVAQPIVGYRIMLLVDGEPVGCEVRRMQLSMGSAADAGASGDGIEVGGVYSASAELLVTDLDAALSGAEVEVRIGVETGDSAEYVTVAVLTVLGVRRAAGVSTVSAAGHIASKMGAAFDAPGWARAEELAAALADACGVGVSLGPFATTDQLVYVEEYSTCRTALAALAAALGGFAAEQNDGSVLVCPFSSTPSCTVGEDTMTAYPSLDEGDYVLDGLTVAVPSAEPDGDEGGEEGEEEAAAGDGDAFYVFGTGRYLVADPHATEGTAAALWQNVRGYAYRPGTVTTAVLDPRVTPFDVAAVEVEGETVNVPVMGLQATYDGGYFGTITAPGMSRAAEDAATEGPVTQAVDKASLAAARASNAAASAAGDAARARESAEAIEGLAQEARDMAGEVNGLATQAATDASSARESASSALQSAKAAAYGLSDVEKVVGTLGDIAAHGRYVSQAGEPFDAAATYYVRDPAGARLDADGNRYALVASPEAADVDSYYRLVVDEAITEYLSSHLWMDGYGLNLSVDSADGYRIHQGTVDGSRAAGMYILDPSGTVVGEFSAVGVVLGDRDNGNYAFIDDDSFDIYHGSTQMTHFGYDEMNLYTPAADEFSEPYYTLGYRWKSAPAFNEGDRYDVGDEVMHDGRIYVCERAITTPHAWDDSDWCFDVGGYSLAEGISSLASGPGAHAEGCITKAVGLASHSEGTYTRALNVAAHAEGFNTKAKGYNSHAEGYGSSASGGNVSTGGAHAEGLWSEASATAAHAQNLHTIAASENQTALGKYNVSDTTGTYAAIIGNGTDNARSNALAVRWDGLVEHGNSQAVAGDNVAYPIFIWDSVNGSNASPESYTGSYPVSPCFVYDKGTGGLYYCEN